MWLAIEGWRDANEEIDALVGRNVDFTFFWRGLMTNLLNPKAAIFYVAVLPSFVSRDLPVFGQTLVLSATYVAVATAIHSSIVALAGAAKPFLDDPVRVRTARRVLAVALGGIAVWFAVSTAR